MSTPCVLSLSTNAGVLTNKRDIVAHLVRHFFENPGQTSDLFEPLMISYLKLVSLYRKTPDALCSEVKRCLSTAIKRCYPNEDITVTCKYSEIDDVKYNLELKITTIDDGTRQPIFINGLMSVDEQGNIKLNLNGI